MWVHDLKDWENVNLDAYKFIFDQGEKRLSQILDESEKITSKAYTLIGIVIPILSLAIGYLIERHEVIYKPLLYILSGVIIIISLCLILLWILIRRRNIWYLGTEPQLIATSAYLESVDLQDEETVKCLYLDGLTHIQAKITSNKEVNRKRITIFSTCLSLILVSFIVIVLSALWCRPC